MIGVHPIANPGIPWEVWRYWEAKYIANYLRRFQNEPCLVMGDFNAIAPGEKLVTESLPDWQRRLYFLQGNRAYHFSIGVFLLAGFTDCYRLLHKDEGFTIPPPKPFARLDYIFANLQMKSHLKKCWIVQEPDSVKLASDHYPVMAEFCL